MKCELQGTAHAAWYCLVKDRRHLLDVFLSSDNQTFNDGWCWCCSAGSDAFGKTVL